jgi:Family of unknown function (DUF5955)
MSNEINIGGSTYGPIAAGRGARADQRDVSINHVGAGTDDGVLAALVTLRELVERHAAEIPEVARVRKDMDTIETETTDPQRDTVAMRDTIQRIVRRVGMVGTVLAAANDLRDIIESLLN